jgi:hypothetical protein
VAKTDYVYVVLIQPDDERLGLEREGTERQAAARRR